MNFEAIKVIYLAEMARTRRTIMQSIISPVISTVLYFVVFGAAIGSRISEVDGVSYGAFIVPGLIMLSLMTQSLSNASFGIYFPRFTGTIFEVLSAPVSFLEITVAYVGAAATKSILPGLIMLSLMTQSLSNASFGIYFPRFTGTIFEVLSAPVSFLEITVAYVGAAATKSILVGLIILITASFFVPLEIQHPVWMAAFFLLTAVTFALLGFIIGIWADNFEKLQFVPLLIVTPLAFLGGSFYSINMLPDIWQKITLINPVVYLISGFRWSFYGQADVSLWLSLLATMIFLGGSLAVIHWIFKTGYRLKA